MVRRAWLSIFSTLCLLSQITLGLNFRNPDQMLDWIRERVCSDPIIIEAGGHLGEDTIRMKKKWPNATMYVFEPMPSSFEKMVKDTGHLSRVACYPYALSSHTGKTCFYTNRTNTGAHSIGYPVSWNEHSFNKTPIEVLCTRLDDWAAEHGVTHVDFMWLDMEGHELEALQNATQILKNTKVIYTEIGFVPLRINGCVYPNLKKFLESKGFVEVWWRKCCTRFGDALFVKQREFENYLGT